MEVAVNRVVNQKPACEAVGNFGRCLRLRGKASPPAIITFQINARRFSSADILAIFSDWAIVGDDLRNAMASSEAVNKHQLELALTY